MIFMILIGVCCSYGQNLTTQFNNQHYFNTPLIFLQVRGPVTTAAIAAQAPPYHPDTWEEVTIHAGDTLTQGIPGASGFYSICHTLRSTNYHKQPYWSALQVQCHPQYGCRDTVRLLVVKKTIKAALAQTLNNPNFGNGKAWQFFILPPDRTNLTPCGTVILQRP